MGYRIKTVAAMTGIPKNTLVAWERRYGVIRPRRLPNGYRMYSDRDVAVIEALKRHLANGYQISEAIELIERAEATGDAASENAPAVAAPSGEAYAAVRDELLAALVEYRREDAAAVHARLAAVPFLTAIEHVHFPVLRVIGQRWAAGEISVAQEHFASAFIRDQLVAMLLALGGGPEGGEHVACATFPGEQHELALLGLAICLALSGKRVTYLGANLPADALAGFCLEHRPGLVCISIVMEQPAEAVLAYARGLREAIDGSTAIVIGGAGCPIHEPSPIDGVRFEDDWLGLRL